MTDAELDRLADLIARAILDQVDSKPTSARTSWLPSPVRPAPPARGSEPPPWSGAAQDLGDVAPTRDGETTPRFRATTAELTRAARAAAAGKAAPPARHHREPERRLTRQRATNAPSID